MTSITRKMKLIVAEVMEVSTLDQCEEFMVAFHLRNAAADRMRDLRNLDPDAMDAISPDYAKRCKLLFEMHVLRFNMLLHAAADRRVAWAAQDPQRWALQWQRVDTDYEVH